MWAEEPPEDVVSVSRHRVINYLATLLAGLRALEDEVYDAVPAGAPLRAATEDTVSTMVEVLDAILSELGDETAVISFPEVVRD